VVNALSHARAVASSQTRDSEKIGGRSGEEQMSRPEHNDEDDGHAPSDNEDTPCASGKVTPVDALELVGVTVSLHEVIGSGVGSATVGEPVAAREALVLARGERVHAKGQL
jgi:hypothetical protein